MELAQNFALLIKGGAVAAGVIHIVLTGVLSQPFGGRGDFPLMEELVALGGGVFITVFICMAVIQACVTIRKGA